jgi:hypothetical protein
LFQYHARLPDIECNPSSYRADVNISLGSRRGLNTKAEALADAGVGEGKALLEVVFDDAHGIDITTNGCQSTVVRDLVALGRWLQELRDKGDWEMDYSVVVEVVTASHATVLASTRAGAQLRYAVGADAVLSPTLVANLSTAGSYVSDRHLGVKVLGGPLTPLFRLAFLRSRFLKSPTIDYRGGTEQEIAISDQDYLLVV